MKQRDWLIMALIFAISFIVYIPTLSGWFIGDDYGFSPIYGMSAKDMLKCLQMVHEGELRLHPFRPVMFASLWLDYHIWGWNSFGFHLTNTLLHACNAVLIWCLARALKMSPTAQLISALFYGLYPGFSEAVVWISGRFDVLAQTFFLTSILLWIEGRRRQDNRWIISSAFIYLLSLFSKETVLGGVLLFPLLDWLFLKGKSRQSNAKFWLTGIIVQSVMFGALILTRAWLFSGNLAGDVGTSRSEQFCGQSLSYCINNLLQDLWIMLTPVSRLVFTDFTVYLVGAFIMFSILLTLFNATFSVVKKDYYPMKVVILGIVWIMAILSPTLFVDPVHPTLEVTRFLYMPCTGLALIVGLGIGSVRVSYRRWLIALTVVWFIISFSTLWQHNNHTWVEAGRVVKGVDQVLFDNTQDIQDGDTIMVINLPWLWNGNYFAPNGYPGYLQWVHNRRHIELMYVEKSPDELHSWWERLQNNPTHRRYIGFVWDDTRQVLEPLQ